MHLQLLLTICPPRTIYNLCAGYENKLEQFLFSFSFTFSRRSGVFLQRNELGESLACHRLCSVPKKRTFLQLYNWKLNVIIVFLVAGHRIQNRLVVELLDRRRSKWIVSHTKKFTAKLQVRNYSIHKSNRSRVSSLTPRLKTITNTRINWTFCKI